jgi:hypothetical protein
LTSTDSPSHHPGTLNFRLNMVLFVGLMCRVVVSDSG